MNIADNFEDADAFYARLVAIHESLDDAQSEQFNLALILFLANHIGDAAALDELMNLAAESLREEAAEESMAAANPSHADGAPQPTAGTSP